MERDRIESTPINDVRELPPGAGLKWGGPACPLPTEQDICPRCARVALRPAHCKLICDGCGYVESCEDILPHYAAGPGDSDGPLFVSP